MLRSVMVDSLIDRHSEESRFDPWFATFAHPTNTYNNGAMPERIDYLMYRCSPNIKMRTYDFTLPQITGKDGSGRPMSVSDHESLHAEFIVEMNTKDYSGVASENDYVPRRNKKRTYDPTDRSGLGYDDLLDIKDDESLYIQDPYSDYESDNTDILGQKSKYKTSIYTSEGPTYDSAEDFHVEIEDETKYSPKKTNAITRKDTKPLASFDKYLQVLYLLNLTSESQVDEFESNRIISNVDTRSDLDY